MDGCEGEEGLVEGGMQSRVKAGLGVATPGQSVVIVQLRVSRPSAMQAPHSLQLQVSLEQLAGGGFCGGWPTLLLKESASMASSVNPPSASELKRT